MPNFWNKMRRPRTGRKAGEQMRVGISTACLYPMETERALERMIAQGFRCFEVFFNTESELEPAYVAHLYDRVRRAGGQILSYHLFTAAFEPMLFFSDYPARFDDALALYRRWAAAVAPTGARVAVLHGARKDSRLPLAEYCRRFVRLAHALREEGITLAQENVARCLSGRVETIRRMRELAGPGGMRFVLDTKQALRAGEDPLAMREAMGGDLVNVHISDSAPAHDCLLPGAGRMDIPALLASLHRGGYDGALTIEVYRGDYGAEEELGASGRWLDSLIKK